MTTVETRHRRHSHAAASDSEKWHGRTRQYDLVKEFVIALVVVSLLTAGLAGLFSSPDEKQVTLSSWSTAAPQDFLMTAATELDGTSGTATYGAPYTHDKSAAQKLGPVSLQNLGGVTHPVDTVNDFVVTPLSSTVGDAAVGAALLTWKAVPAAQRTAWATAYDEALQTAQGNPAHVVSGDYGPVPVMLAGLLRLAQAGGLDGALLLQHSFYSSDYTKPLLFVADGTYLEDKANAQHLLGDQWGMMNETGSYPGQAWLWLYTFWYQISPFNHSDNADALIWGLMAVLTLAFILIPFIPGVRSIPRYVPIYRLIWRDHYRRQRTR